MRVLLVGATGHIGSVVSRELQSTHEVIAVSRTSDVSVDLTRPASIAKMYEAVGVVDAVVACTGAVTFKPFAELTYDDYIAGLVDKAMGQVELVRQGSDYVTDGGSFTLTSGILAREPIWTGVAASMANGALESFVMAAAVELRRGLRINAVSPSVLQSAPEYHAAFLGFERVSDEALARAFVRSIEGPETGRVFSVA